MPALTMRGRYLMREYWSDSDLFIRLDAAEREVYIGLWMLADDSGWLPRDVPGVAAALYRYEDRSPRESRVVATLAKLHKMGKVTSFRCCLYLPAVSRYPRAGKRTSEHEIEHRQHSNRIKAIRTHSNPSPFPSSRNPSSPDVAGEGARDDAPPGETEFKRKTGWVAGGNS